MYQSLPSLTRRFQSWLWWISQIELSSAVGPLGPWGILQRPISAHTAGTHNLTSLAIACLLEPSITHCIALMSLISKETGGWRRMCSGYVLLFLLAHDGALGTHQLQGSPAAQGLISMIDSGRDSPAPEAPRMSSSQGQPGQLLQPPAFHQKELGATITSYSAPAMSPFFVWAVLFSF